MSEEIRYRTLADWYDECAECWLKYANAIRSHAFSGAFDAHSRTGSTREWLDMAKEATYRAARYARLATKTRKEEREAVQKPATPKLEAVDG